MPARAIGAFAVGFACGSALIAAGLWYSGAIALPVKKIATQPSPDNAGSRAAERRSPHGPGQADRSVETPRLDMPIAGVDPTTLHDTFNDARAGGKHEALDIPAARGTPVRAAAPGQIVKLFNSKRGGLTVYQFDGSRNWCYYYAHLDGYAGGIKDGDMVSAGAIVGYVGSTGDASPDAPHLHFAVFRLGPEKKWWKGEAVDPLPLLMP